MAEPSTRPLIGVTAYRQATRWWSWDRDAAVVPGVYLDMVVAAGGWPVLLPPLADGAAEEGDAVAVARMAGTLVDAVDGLVVIGGGDVSADRYGQEPDERNGGANQFRDELELQLLDAALERDLPLLAICRGHQVLNVLLGGSLVQQLPDLLGSTRHQPRAGEFGEVTVVDVRDQDEWDAGHLPGALHLPLATLAAHVADIPADRPVVLQCQGGGRSSVAASLLRAAGRADASNLTGGFGEWARRGLRVERPEESR